MSYVLSSPNNDEKVFESIRLLYRQKTRKGVGDCVSQRWFKEISDETLQYARYRKFLQIAQSKQKKLVGFAILFSSVIETFEKGSVAAFEKARKFLFDEGYDFSRCLFLYHVVDESYQDAFGGMALNLISRAKVKSKIDSPNYSQVYLEDYISHIIVLQHENIELHFQLIKYKFDLIGSLSMGKGKLPMNIFSYSIA